MERTQRTGGGLSMPSWRSRQRDDARGFRARDRAHGAASVQVTDFEYVPVGTTALARIAGRAPAPVPATSDIALIVQNGRGDEHVQALPDSAGAEPGGRWRMAFATSLHTMERRDVVFKLRFGRTVTALPAPTERAAWADAGARTLRGADNEDRAARMER